MQETAPRRSASSAPSKEVLFDINDAAFSSDEFRMYQFKIKRCPRARPHDWTLCPFAHPGEKAKRRDPRKKKYSGTACPDFRKGGSCPRGDSCPFAHGVFECWLHPSRYRTQMCTDGENCERRVCFFAHLESELREAEADPVLLNFQLHPEMFGGAPSPAQFYPPYQHGGYPVPDFMAGGVPHPHYGLHLPSAMAPMPLGMAQPALAAGDSTAPAGTVQPDHSAPCTPTAPSLTPTLTPATSQDSATLLAHLQALQQQQQQAVGGSAHGGASQWAAPSASLPASVAQSPAQADAGTGVAGAPGGPRSVSASASGGTLGSSSSPPISPTGVAALSELTQNLNCGGGTAALEALLQQQQQHGGGGGSGDAARQLASLLGGDHAQQGSDAAALAALLQQQLGLGASSYDQTALLVALHSLSLGGSLPECHPPAGGLSAGLIRHASDVYMQQRAAAAVAALTPPGHGLVSHRRSMDNSMLAQLHSLSRSSPLPLDPYLHQDSPAAPDTGPQAARLSPVSIPSTHRHHHRSPQQQQQHTPDMAACLTNGSLTPPSPSYLAHLTATPASPYANLGGHGAAHPHQQRTSSPLAAGGPLHPIVTLTGGQQDVGMTSAGMQLPPTPQTAPANMGRTAWSNQLGCIDEEQPGGAGELPDSPPSLPCVYKTLSDPSALIRNLSFDNILAELPRSSSQVSLTALQPGATSAKGAEGVREGGDLVNGTQAGRDRQGAGEEGGT